MGPAMPLQPILVIGVIFGFLASLMAFLIIHDEFKKHKLQGWPLWKEGLGGAAFTFVVFLVLSLIAGYWLSYLIQ
jgi:H+/Cl- antiporter ClcA